MKIYQGRCQTSQLDFEFLLDSSGSVGINDWNLMTATIADKWLPLLDPVYGENGIHVASRWFSSNTDRFIDFQEKSFTSSGKVQLKFSIIFKKFKKSFFKKHRIIKNFEQIMRIYGLYSISAIYNEKYEVQRWRN